MQVDTLCTHRPSLLPIEWFSEIIGQKTWQLATVDVHFWKTIKLGHLEEVKVVTRFP